ncbi:transglutaminaseTgpA domain-containing protein [Amnibacterium flavum]|uniref:Transglutaminase-like domain-containing protein n=1 Tax=Amnibacterium flavum TaxID=2173173 RepID=A0A2V1HXG2_9MICO|nr:DUF3488 and transglutaminase-like domain-containing protein [Amnibacterium flavum]PVZ95004.1 hypothetical protein DDQ50_00230 [Amnibacterium flavum]
MSERSATVPKPRRARRPQGSGLAVSAAALLTVLAASASFGTLVEGSGWWWKAAIVSTVAVAAAAAVRLRWRAWPIPTLAALVAAVVMLLALFAQQTLALGIIPTADTVEQVRYLILSAVEHIRVESIPAAEASGLDFILAGGITAVAIVVESLAVSARAPVLAALWPLALAVAPGRAVSSESELGIITLTLVFVLAMIWLDRRRDAPRTPLVAAVIVAVLAIFGGLIGQTTAPAVSDASASTGGLLPVFASGGDPLVRLGDHLRRGLDVPALSYTTTSDQPVYLRVVTIDDLTGEDWEATPLDESPQGARTVDEFPAVPGLAGDVTRAEVSTVVEDAFAERRWLPIPYPATSVEIESPGQWAWDPESLTAGVRRDGQYAGVYTVNSLQIEPTAEQLRSAPSSDSVAFQRYLELPDDIPAIIGETTAEITADEVNGYDQAIAIQNYLRGSDFRYDESTPEQADGDGDSFDVIGAFLDQKRGYCVHFASTMTVMARQLGIPARIAVGYQPGERQILDPTSYDVTSHDLHAWPELYFEGVGWTRFEPTPGRGSVPDYTTAAAAAAQPTEETAPEPTPTTSAAAREENVGGPTDTSATTGFTGLSWWLLLPVGVLALVLAPAITRIMRRRARFARSATVSAAWDELHDSAEDLGLARPSMSPRELAAAIEASVELDPGDAAALIRWRGLTERDRFGQSRDIPIDLPRGEIRDLLRAMRRSRPVRFRVLAWLLPRSLATSWRTGPGARFAAVDAAR